MKSPRSLYSIFTFTEAYIHKGILCPRPPGGARLQTAKNKMREEAVKKQHRAVVFLYPYPAQGKNERLSF